MKGLLFALFFVATFFGGLTVPAPTEAAGLVVCALNADDTGTANIDESLPCTACHILLMADSIIDWITRVMTVVGIAVIFAMGILYIVSAGNEKMIGMAKGGIKAALIGVTVILMAWLIVNTIIRLSGSSTYFSDYFQTGTFSFTCDTTSNAGSASSTNFGAGTGTGGAAGSGGGTGYSGSGSCQPVTNSASNPCSTANLSKTCFGGAQVNAWSAICQAESGGNTSIASSVDICKGDGSVVSFGLFQINISANKIGNLNCPSAFSSVYTGANKNCRVIDRDLYSQCVSAAKNASQNIATACKLAAPNATNTGPWGAARRCNIPKSL
jgi:hypothetical protein